MTAEGIFKNEITGTFSNTLHKIILRLNLKYVKEFLIYPSMRSNDECDGVIQSFLDCQSTLKITCATLSYIINFKSYCDSDNVFLLDRILPIVGFFGVVVVVSGGVIFSVLAAILFWIRKYRNL